MCSCGSGETGPLDTWAHFYMREVGRRREDWKEEHMSFPNACPASPQSPTGPGNSACVIF